MDKNKPGIIASGIQPIEDAVKKKADTLMVRAKAHGVDLSGKSYLLGTEMLIDRLDAYRDVPAYKGRILID